MIIKFNPLFKYALIGLSFIPLLAFSAPQKTQDKPLVLISKESARATLPKLAQESMVSLADLTYAFNRATLKESIITAMNRPGEAKPWYEYRKIFIIPKRITLGQKFFQENHKDLLRAASYYGVDPEVIVAIIGVETFYGANMGRFKVLDALYTLGFYYPKRESYFKKEFANFIKLAKAQNWQYDQILGSYAGAMGMGQFMPYSYLTWAVDFNNDNHINLFTDKTDVIGSVANYFKAHGYDKNKDTIIKLAMPIGANNQHIDKLLTDGIELKITVGALRKAGFVIPNKYPDKEPCKLIKLESNKGSFTYYAALHNFAAIMRYNRSPLYAMAVHELAELIKGPMTLPN